MKDDNLLLLLLLFGFIGAEGIVSVQLRPSSIPYMVFVYNTWSLYTVHGLWVEKVLLRGLVIT